MLDRDHAAPLSGRKPWSVLPPLIHSNWVQCDNIGNLPKYQNLARWGSRRMFKTRERGPLWQAMRLCHKQTEKQPHPVLVMGTSRYFTTSVGIVRGFVVRRSEERDFLRPLAQTPAVFIWQTDRHDDPCSRYIRPIPQLSRPSHLRASEQWLQAPCPCPQTRLRML